MSTLPNCSARFLEKKSTIISQLSIPSAEYTDASPKGSVDEGVRELISELNAVHGVVTTSSCAGRVSVFVEGKKAATTDDDAGDGQVAGVGGKGAGGTWLFVSHDPVPAGSEDWIKSLKLDDTHTSQQCSTEKRLIHFKFEPMVGHQARCDHHKYIYLTRQKILHILTASPAHAQLLVRCALEAGFRESGAINITSHTDDPATPIVAVRSMGLGFESLIGTVSHNERVCFVTPEYLQMLMDIATERFAENAKRIDRFLKAFRHVFNDEPAPPKKNQDGLEWEDATARRERKRAEGLRRKAELEEKKGNTVPSDQYEPDANLQTGSLIEL